MYCAVALGGAVGAMGRAFGYSVTFRRGFSLHTFAVNIVGSAVIGVIWVLFSRWTRTLRECVPHDGRAGWLYDFFQLLFGDGATGARPVDDCRALCCGKRVVLRRSRGTGHSLGARL